MVLTHVAGRLCGCHVGTVLIFVLVSGYVAGSDVPSPVECGGEFRAGVGVIRSPITPGLLGRYPVNVRCEWTIVAPKSRRVRIDFSTFELQSSDQCGADYLEILSDVANASPMVLCGQDLPRFVVSVGHVLRLVFVSDASVTGTGFNLFYESVPSDVPDASTIVWLEQNLPDMTAKLQSLPADPADYITSGNVVTSTMLKHWPANWTALAADYHDRHFFWSDPRLKLLWRADIRGDKLIANSVYRGTSSEVTGIAVDWLARTVYWTDATYNWIMVSNYEGSRSLPLLNDGLDRPSGIAVHPIEGFLFWADGGGEPRIERSRLNGQDRRVLVGSEAGYPVGITIDFSLDRLFWTSHSLDGQRSSIYSASIHGESVTELFALDYGSYVLNDLTIFKNYLYVTDSTNQLHCFQKNEATLSSYFTFQLGSRRPFGLTTYADNNQPLQPSGCDSNPCEYLCVSDGTSSHSCLCKSGYHALEDGTCVQGTDILIPPPQLLVVAEDSICMYPNNWPDLPDTSQAGQCILTHLPRAVALTSDATDGQLFYATIGDNAIHGVGLQINASTAVVVEGIGEVHGIAVDWITKHLYWTDSSMKHIAVAGYDGRHRTVLIRSTVDQPGSIAVDPHQRFIFWTYLDSGTQIERAGLDGSDRVVILRGVMEPRGITLDYSTKTLYFAERGTGLIQSIDYTGRERTQIFQKTGGMFTGLDIYKDYLVWTEERPNNELNAVNRVTGEFVRQVPLNGMAESARGVSMYAESRQAYDQNLCTNSSHGCQQLCLPAPMPKQFVCACAIGYTLAEDRVSCTSDVVMDNFILVADSFLGGIYQVDLSTYIPSLQALPLANISNPLSVDYDPLMGFVYWNDVTGGTISRSSLTGSHQEIVVTSAQGQTPYSLVVDSNSRLIYWTDIEANSIKVCRLHGAYQRTLANTSASPRALATLPTDGLLFWTWWGPDGAGIGKASMDGSNVEILLSEGEGFFHGIAVDAVDRRLYWTNARAQTIESVSLDSGDSRRTIPLAVGARPFGVAVVDGRHVFWTEQGSRKLLRADKTTGSDIVMVGNLDLAGPSGLHAQGASAQSIVNNACSLSNGGCGGLCLPTPIGRTCACAEGDLVDEDGTCPTDPGTSIDTEIELAFTSQPSDVNLQIGMEISQKCSSNQASASIEWKKDTVPLTLGLSEGIYVLPDGALMILDVDESHRGLYTCTITATSGQVIESTAEFKFNPDDVFELTPESVEIPEGEDHILTCSAREASYVIRWEKNSAPLQLSDMVHVISGDNLIIRQAVASDSGKYTCIAQTLGGVRVADVTAQVTVRSHQVVEEVCGLVTSQEALADGVEDEEDRTYRITGGTTAKRGSSPWIARLWFNEGRKHFCGGSLLNRYWILTGAHCITEYSIDVGDIRVRLGDHDSYSTEDSEQFIGVQHIQVYPEFDAAYYDSDLALVKLADPVDEFTDYLRPICLPSKSLARRLLTSGTMGKVVGWGQLVQDGPYPRYLTEVTVPVVGQQKCRVSTVYSVTENMFCAGYKKRKGDACQGDSGGPFSIKHKKRWYQLGIVSWGEGCGRVGKYGFYTRLVKFLRWMNMYMENN